MYQTGMDSAARDASQVFPGGSRPRQPRHKPPVLTAAGTPRQSSSWQLATHGRAQGAGDGAGDRAG